MGYQPKLGRKPTEITMHVDGNPIGPVASISSRAPLPEPGSRSPFRDNLASHEARVAALKRELAEAIDRRDYHAVLVLPSGIGLRGFDRALRRLLRQDIDKAAARARPGWWPRLVAWLRWGSRDTRAKKTLQQLEDDENTMLQELMTAYCAKKDIRIVSDNRGPVGPCSNGTGRTGPVVEPTHAPTAGRPVAK